MDSDIIIADNCINIVTPPQDRFIDAINKVFSLRPPPPPHTSLTP